MRETIVQRVATALFAHEVPNACLPPGPGIWYESVRKTYEAKALAAIAAMAEPTEAMIRAAEWVEGYAEITRQTTSVAAQVWRDMAGAILTEPQLGQGNDT